MLIRMLLIVDDTFNVDDLIKKIDAKIAELEAEENEKLNYK